MVFKTDTLFREDAYLKSAEATVLARTGEGGLIFDRTIFYATSGGQPGDTGFLQRADGTRISVTGAITGETKDEIIHIPETDHQISVGEKMQLFINWERRHALMRMHTACHLLSVVCPFGITGAAVGENESRVDFDLPDPAYTKELVTEKLMELVNANVPISHRWITDEELLADPTIIRSKNVRPPIGSGQIRLVLIGENGNVDSQPCGGTHVSSTREVGDIHIGKIEKKGRENRRFRIRFGPLPQA